MITSSDGARTSGSPRPAGAGPTRRWVPRGLAAALVVTSAAACAVASGAADPPAPTPTPEDPRESRFDLALDHIERDEFEAAAGELAELAGACESGPLSRNAILLLASLELNPHNPIGSPSSGARLAARYLQIPAASEASVAMAETLYLLAVDLGAEPVSDPYGAPPEGMETAFAFGVCDETGEATVVRDLPQPPGPVTTRAALAQASSQRDSLATVVDSLTRRTVELEAELDRIRRLLTPDSVGVGGGSRPPGP